VPASPPAGPVPTPHEGTDMSDPTTTKTGALSAGGVGPGHGFRVTTRIPIRELVWGVTFVAVLLLAYLGMPSMLSNYRLDLLAKYVCLAILGVGIGLAWGQGGMLTLGQGLFFGLGAYSMGMYLKLEQAGPGHVADFQTQF